MTNEFIAIVIERILLAGFNNIAWYVASVILLGYLMAITQYLVRLRMMDLYIARALCILYIIGFRGNQLMNFWFHLGVLMMNYSLSFFKGLLGVSNNAILSPAEVEAVAAKLTLFGGLIKIGTNDSVLFADEMFKIYNGMVTGMHYCTSIFLGDLRNALDLTVKFINTVYKKMEMIYGKIKLMKTENKRTDVCGTISREKTWQHPVLTYKSLPRNESIVGYDGSHLYYNCRNLPEFGDVAYRDPKVTRTLDYIGRVYLGKKKQHAGYGVFIGRFFLSTVEVTNGGQITVVAPTLICKPLMVYSCDGIAVYYTGKRAHSTMAEYNGAVCNVVFFAKLDDERLFVQAYRSNLVCMVDGFYWRFGSSEWDDDLEMDDLDTLKGLPVYNSSDVVGLIGSNLTEGGITVVTITDKLITWMSDRSGDIVTDLMGGYYGMFT